MALENSTNRVQYTGDGSTITFSVPFIFWDDDDVEVVSTIIATGVEEIWTRGTQYTITGGSGNTGTLTVIITPTDYTPASTTTLTLRSKLPNTQPTILPTGGALSTAALEQQLDQTVRQVQQLSEALGRSITLNISSTFTDIIVPDPEVGKILRWNSVPDALENVDAQGSGSLTTPVSIADGGTAGATKAAALTNLGIKLAPQRISLWKLGQF